MSKAFIVDEMLTAFKRSSVNENGYVIRMIMKDPLSHKEINCVTATFLNWIFASVHRDFAFDKNVACIIILRFL